MRVAILIFLFAKAFLAVGASIEGDAPFNLLFRINENPQKNKIEEKPTENDDTAKVNQMVPLNSYLQSKDDGKYKNQESQFLLNPVKSRDIFLIRPLYEAKEQDSSLSNNGEVAVVANPVESVAKPVEIVEYPYENDVKSDEINEKPIVRFVQPENSVNVDDTQVKPEETKEIAANPDGKFIQQGDIIEKTDEVNENPIEDVGVTHSKTSLKEFLSKLFGNKEDPKISGNDNTKEPAVQIEQVQLPDYDYLLANKPFYDALLIEKGLLTRVNKLETIIDSGLSEPRLNAESGYALEEVYQKDFILGIMNIKTEILKFINWRTAKRLRNLYAGIKLGQYESKPMPTADFYKEIKYLLQMVRLADIVVDMERVNSLEDNSKISEPIPVNEISRIERPSIDPYYLEKDNNVPKDENIQPIDEINDNNQSNTIQISENVDNNVYEDENVKPVDEINDKYQQNPNKIVEIGDNNDQDASNDMMMLTASPYDDRAERKDEPVESIDHPEYSTDEHIFPFWMLWIVEPKFKLQNIHHKNKHSRSWTFLQYGYFLHTNYDEDAILISDDILNSNKMGTILDSNKLNTIPNLGKLKFFPSTNKTSDKHYSTSADAIELKFNTNKTLKSKQILNSDQDDILNLNRKRAIWSLEKIGQILNLNRVGDSRRTKIKDSGYQNSNHKGNFFSYKTLTAILNSDKAAILNLKRKRAIWSLKKIGQIMNSNRIGDRQSKIISDIRKSNNMGNFISYKKTAAILNSKRKRAMRSLTKIGQILNSKRVAYNYQLPEINGKDRKSNNKGIIPSYEKMASFLKISNDYSSMDAIISSRREEVLEQDANNVKPVKRGFSMLTRLKLFSLLSDGYIPPRRIYFPKEPVFFLKNNQVISAETRAMLRPVGAPLRWG